MEFAKYNIDIAALCETRFSDSGSLNGKPEGERREAGVGFTINKDIVTKLTEMPRPVSDKIMTMRLPLSKDNFATIISEYAPTMTNPNENKEAFYNQLATVLSGIPRTDKLLLIGDFNARIGRDNDKGPLVMGKHGIGKCKSSNDELLLALCPEFEMITRCRDKMDFKQDRPLYMVFVDFSRAFVTVGSTGLLQLLRKYGCPENFSMIEALHTGMTANVSVGGEVSESFSVTNVVKQGCVLAPTLFSIFLRAMLDEAFRVMGVGVYIQFRQSADLFNVEHFKAKTKTTRILMRGLLFADDSALVAHSGEEMQKIVDGFSDASKMFGLMINIKKIEVPYQPNSTRTREEDIMVDGHKLNSVLEITYFGSTMSSNGCIDVEIQRRMTKANASFS